MAVNVLIALEAEFPSDGGLYLLQFDFVQHVTTVSLVFVSEHVLLGHLKL